MMKLYVQKIVWVVISLPKVVLKKMQYHKRCQVAWLEHFELGARLTLMDGNGILEIGRGCHVKRGTELLISGDGSIRLEEHVCINSNCYVASQEHVEIGEGSEIGQNVIIVDLSLIHI